MKTTLLEIILIATITSIDAQIFDYFGQTPPGDSAIIFAPGIISLNNRLERQIHAQAKRQTPCP